MITDRHGTNKPFFSLSNGDVKIVDQAGVAIAAQNEAGNLIILRALGIGSPAGETDLVNKANMFQFFAPVSFAINGGTPPAAGNTGTFGIVTVAGGGYSLGSLWYDNGVSLVEVASPTYMVPLLELTGNLPDTLVQYGLYFWDEVGTQWRPLGGTDKGASHISVPFAYTDGTVLSAKSVEDGVVCHRAVLVITTPFNDPAATVSASIGAVSLIDAADFDVSRAEQYEAASVVIISTGGAITVTVSPAASTQGAGMLYVWTSKG